MRSILLLKGRDSIDKIDHDYAVLAAIILAVAAVLGAFAAFKLFDAAYGQPASQDLTTIRQKSLYVWRYERAVEAANNLRLGQAALLVSVALVGATVLFTWFAPEPSSTPAYRVTDAAGNCGQLAKATNGELKIVVDEQAPVIVRDISQLQVVRKCP